MKKTILFSTLFGLALLISACGPAAASTQAPAPTATTAPTASAMPVATATSAPTASAMPVATATSAPTASAMPVASPSSAATVMVGQNSTLNSFLAASNGMTLYIFTNDTPGASNCNGQCASLWPPLLTNGAPVAGQGVNASLLGTITRSDGSTQVTYNNWPLYYYSKDSAAGDTTGEGVGSVWFVITPDGNKE